MGGGPPPPRHRSRTALLPRQRQPPPRRLRADVRAQARDRRRRLAGRGRIQHPDSRPQRPRDPRERGGGARHRRRAADRSRGTRRRGARRLSVSRVALAAAARPRRDRVRRPARGARRRVRRHGQRAARAARRDRATRLARAHRRQARASPARDHQEAPPRDPDRRRGGDAVPGAHVGAGPGRGSRRPTLPRHRVVRGRGRRYRRRAQPAGHRRPATAPLRRHQAAQRI